MAESEDEARARKARERAEELARVPFQAIDKSKWPPNVRPIAMGEADGLGIDVDGRLHWNGKPVEIVGTRLDLTKGQFIIALLVAIFTAIAAAATAVQAWTAYDDWACKVNWPAVCAPPVPPSAAETPRAKSSVAD